MAFHIVLSCEDERITYVKRNVTDHMKSYSNMTVGWIDMPLSDEGIDEIIFNDDYHGCPHGIYRLANHNTVRAIVHGDIEFCRWNKVKTVIFLKDGETEEVGKSIAKIKAELPEDYFSECVKGYIVNFYNVKKIDRVNHDFIMYSGHKIPISYKKFTGFVRKFIEVMFGM
jgi:hypothetical protein